MAQRDWRYSTLAYWLLGTALVFWGCLAEFLALLNLRMAVWPALTRTLEVCLAAFLLSLIGAFVLLRHPRRSALLASLVVALLGPGLAAYHGYQYGHFTELMGRVRQLEAEPRLLSEVELEAIRNSDIVYRSQLIAYAELHNALYEAQAVLDRNRDAFATRPPLQAANLSLDGIHRSRDRIAQQLSVYAEAISVARSALRDVDHSRTAISLAPPLESRLRQALEMLQSRVDELRARMQARRDFLMRLDQALAYVQGLEVNGDVQVQGSVVFFASLRGKTAFAAALSDLQAPADFPVPLTPPDLGLR